jgi:hypothetical protein
VEAGASPASAAAAEFPCAMMPAFGRAYRAELLTTDSGFAGIAGVTIYSEKTK